MDFDDLITRYKSYPAKKRMLALAVIAVLPALSDFATRWSDLDAARTQAFAERNVEDGKLKEALRKHEMLSQLGAELKDYKTKMQDASKRLPDEIYMDQILQKTELISQEIGISLKTFKPMEELASDTAFRYIMLPIQLDLLGTYGQIASFFDHVLHLETIIHIENYQLSVDSLPSDNPIAETDPEKMEEIKRSQMRIHATCEMVVFRAQTEQESNAIQSTIDEMNKAKSKPEPKAGAGEDKNNVSA